MSDPDVFTRLAALQPNWDSYGADPPSALAIENARRFVAVAERMGYPPMRVAPAVVGGVGVTHRQGERKTYAEFYNDGRVLVLFSDDVQREPIVIQIQPTDAEFERFAGASEEWVRLGVMNWWRRGETSRD